MASWSGAEAYDPSQYLSRSSPPKHSITVHQADSQLCNLPIHCPFPCPRTSVCAVLISLSRRSVILETVTSADSFAPTTCPWRPFPQILSMQILVSAGALLTAGDASVLALPSPHLSPELHGGLGLVVSAPLCLWHPFRCVTLESCRP